MVHANLMLHVDSKKATLADLEALPAPQALGPRHVPVHPAHFVKSLVRAVESYDFTIDSMEIGLNQKKTRHFGVMRLSGGENLPGIGTALGWASSTDQSIRAKLAGGGHVFVCDNLALSGDVVLLSHKHTRGFTPVRAFEEGMENQRLIQQVFHTQILQAQEITLSRTVAESYLWQLFTKGVLPKKLMTPVSNAFFTRPEASGVEGDTLWDLHNAATYALKEEPMTTKWDRTRQLGVFLAQAVAE